MQTGNAGEIFIDNFAGGGGASTGIAQALGFPVHAALNHNREALAMHRINHRETLHFREDIRTADPKRITGGRSVGGVWFSPDCKHFSKAKGGKPRSKKIRGLAWVVINWINRVAPRVIFLENVEEFQTWCPLLRNGKPSEWREGWFFWCFVGAMRRRGYVVDWREIRAYTAGAPTIRKRLYLIARRDGLPIRWPEATHTSPDLAVTNRKPWRTTAECLDYTLPCPSIFLSRDEARKWNCKRPLVPATLSRVAKGLDRHVLKTSSPCFITPPGGVQTVVPVISYAQHGGSVRAADTPAHTLAASPKDQNQVIIAYLAQHNGGFNTVPGHDLRQPASTISSRGSQQQLVTCALALVKYYGTDQDPRLNEPAHTITTKARFGLLAASCQVRPITPEQEVGARRVAAFLRSQGIEFGGDYAMAGDYAIYDVGMRMLRPRELYLIQGFPADYIIDRGLDETGEEITLSITAQVRMCGNSVCPPVAESLVKANLPELCRVRSPIAA